MSLSPYPSYKATRIGWLGEIPESWRIVPAKALFGERRERNRDSDLHLTPSQKYGVLSQEDYMSISGNKVVLNLSGSDAMRHVEPRDFISHLRSFQGGLELSMLTGKVSAAYTVLFPRVDAVEVRYFKYLFKSYLYVQALQTTTDQLRDGQSIRYAQFTRIPLCLPSVVEQREIADYLDDATSRIDLLIGKQERLIAMLAERRQAVISHAVTKGLDQNGHLRWAATRLRHHVRLNPSISPDVRRQGDRHLLFLEMASIGDDGSVRRDVSRPAVELLSGYSYFEEGDLLMAKVTPCFENGKGAVAREVPLNAGFATTEVTVIRASSTLDVDFLYYVTHTDSFMSGGTAAMTGAGGLRRVPDNFIRNFLLKLPPIAEQRRIADYLNREMRQIAVLSSKAREMIAVLKERREALISAAVTGKINVRGLS